MSLEEEINQWKAALAEQQQRKSNELQIIAEHKKELENANQQILMLSGGLTFAEKLETNPTDETPLVQTEAAEQPLEP